MDATLKNLTISAGGSNIDLNQSFSPDVLTYTTIVPNEITEALVTPIVNDANASVSVNGSSKMPSSVKLKVGGNMVSILVTAEDGVNTLTYQVKIGRAKSSDATLSNLTVAAGGYGVAFDHSFTPGTVNYVATVPFETTSVQITPTANSGSAFIFLSGVPIPSGVPIKLILLPGHETSCSFDVVAEDGATTLSYTITVVRAPAITATNDSAVTLQGRPVTIDVTRNDTGGPFTSVRTASSPSHGTTAIAGLMITYTPDPQYVGTDSFTYSAVNGSAVSTPATVTVTISARPDPSRDPSVIGIVQAQTQAATQIANSQISNFNDRMDALHGDGYAPNSFGIIVQNGVPSEAPPSTSAYADEMAATQKAEASRQATARALKKQDPAVNRAAERIQRLDNAFAIWTAGSIQVGRLSANNQVEATQLSTSGLSLGADYRLNRFLSIGLGAGFGATQADIGINGSSTRVRAYNIAAYAVLRPTDYSFIDALIGTGTLDLKSQRYIAADQSFATGKRTGSEVFGSLTAGMTYRHDQWQLVPYTRLQFVQGTLNAFTETGSIGNTLTFNRQTFATTSLNLGFKGKLTETFQVANQEVKASPFVRVEYQHDLTRRGSASVTWADLPGSQSYTITLPGSDTDRLHLGLGAELDLQGFLFALEYQDTLGKSSNTQSVRAKLTRRF